MPQVWLRNAVRANKPHGPQLTSMGKVMDACSEMRFKHSKLVESWRTRSSREMKRDVDGDGGDGEIWATNDDAKDILVIARHLCAGTSKATQLSGISTRHSASMSTLFA